MWRPIGPAQPGPDTAAPLFIRFAPSSGLAHPLAKLAAMAVSFSELFLFSPILANSRHPSNRFLTRPDASAFAQRRSRSNRYQCSPCPRKMKFAMVVKNSLMSPVQTRGYESNVCCTIQGQSTHYSCLGQGLRGKGTQEPSRKRHQLPE